MRRAALAVAVVLGWTAVAPAQVTTFLWNINANGIKEVNAQGVSNGDPDGTGVGTFRLTSNGATGTTGVAVFDILLTNVDLPLTLYHVHQAPTTTSGPVFLDFGNPSAILTGNRLQGTVSNLDNARINTIFGNAGNFYLNLHNAPFPAGAVRDQLSAVPEPSSIALVGTAAVGLWLRRRRGK